jgi:hypothetical protein
VEAEISVWRLFQDAIFPPLMHQLILALSLDLPQLIIKDETVAKKL